VFNAFLPFGTISLAIRSSMSKTILLAATTVPPIPIATVPESTWVYCRGDGCSFGPGSFAEILLHQTTCQFIRHHCCFGCGMMTPNLPDILAHELTCILRPDPLWQPSPEYSSFSGLDERFDSDTEGDEGDRYPITTME